MAREKRMTEEDAINILMHSNEYHHAKGDLPQSTESIEAFNMAIKALERQQWLSCHNITDEQISLAFQAAIVNYWESKSKYLTPPPSPAQCCNCQTESLISRYQHDFISNLTEVIKEDKPNCSADMGTKEGEEK